MTRNFWSLILVVLLGASSRLCAAADKANFAYSALSGLQAAASLRAISLGFNQVLDYSNELLFPLASLTTTRAYTRQSPAVAQFKAESFHDSTFIDELRKEGD